MSGHLIHSDGGNGEIGFANSADPPIQLPVGFEDARRSNSPLPTCYSPFTFETPHRLHL
jgi:hypothetical protein